MPAKVEHALQREFELSDTEFARLREMVYECTGIALVDSKRELVYGRLVRRLRQGVEFFQFLRNREDMIVS